MIPLITQQKLDALAQEHGSKLLADVKRALNKYRSSSELADSPALTIIKSTDTEAARIVITYADQGFFIGQRNPQWTRLPNIDNLETWAKNVNLNGPVPGYKNGLAPNLPPWKRAQRILWAIAKGKQKFDTHKPKRWKREAKLGDALKELNTETIATYERDVIKILTEAIEGKS